METQRTPRQFVVIFVLGAPGAGKGTLCSHLSQAHNLTHYSVGDGLRDWMREHRDEPLALQIQDKLDNQGFLAPEDLNPFILQEIKDAVHQSGISGILVDGFPRSTEQLETFANWPFQDELPLASNSRGAVKAYAKPDVVLFFGVAKHNARARYLGRARDSNDSKEKFERRFAEYERETLAVEDVYRHRGVLIDIDVNGTKEENVDNMTAALLKNDLWQKTVIEGSAETNGLVWFALAQKMGVRVVMMTEFQRREEQGQTGVETKVQLLNHSEQEAEAMLVLWFGDNRNSEQQACEGERRLAASEFFRRRTGLRRQYSFADPDSDLTYRKHIHHHLIIAASHD